MATHPIKAADETVDLKPEENKDFHGVLRVTISTNFIFYSFIFGLMVEKC